MGALTINQRLGEGVHGGGIRFKVLNVSPSTSYAAGGETFDVKELGLSNLMGGQVLGYNAAAVLKHAHVDVVNSKLSIALANGTEDSGNLSALQFILYVIGR